MRKLGLLLAFLVAGLGTAAIAADFNGDGTNDIGIFRASTGLWSVFNLTRFFLGSGSDRAVPGDYNGDGTVEGAIFRSGDGLWSVRNVTRVYMGTGYDDPLPGVLGNRGGGGGLWNQSGSDIYYDAGDVGIGTSTLDPCDSLTVDGGRARFANSLCHGVEIYNSAWDALFIHHTPYNGITIQSCDQKFISTGESTDDAFNVQSTGKVGIGVLNPTNKIHVVGAAEYAVARFVNENGTPDADGLSIELNTSASPGSGNKFIGFWQMSTPVGSIVGNGSGGVILQSGGSDFAEFMPRLQDPEAMESGDIVGIVDGKITKTTWGAEQVQVISSAPIVLGNDPGAARRNNCEQVALIGHAPTKVEGAVRAGDYIVPSGRNDGTGVSISPDKITLAQCAQIVGRAVETREEQGVKLVKTAVGINVAASIVGKLGQEKDSQIESLSRRLQTLEDKFSQIENQK